MTAPSTVGTVLVRCPVCRTAIVVREAPGATWYRFSYRVDSDGVARANCCCGRVVYWDATGFVRPEVSVVAVARRAELRMVARAKAPPV